MPKPLTLINDHPGFTVGVGTSVYSKTSGPPGCRTTIAFIWLPPNYFPIKLCLSKYSLATIEAFRCLTET